MYSYTMGRWVGSKQSISKCGRTGFSDLNMPIEGSSEQMYRTCERALGVNPARMEPATVAAVSPLIGSKRTTAPGQRVCSTLRAKAEHG